MSETTVIMQNPMQLTGRRILVTGASAGIGRATAILLSQLGASVISVGRNQERLQQTQKQLAPGNHAATVIDLSDLDAIPRQMQDLVAKEGQLNGLVHAAGMQMTLPLKMLAVSKWREMLLINTEASLVLAQAFQSKDVCATSGGAIVFISSVLGQVGAPGRSVYSLTKGALDAMAKSLALELAPRKIRVNCVAPAFVRTAMYEEMARFWSSTQQMKVENDHPLGLGAPEDIANAVAFLIADTGRWITGSTLVVDGGYTAH